MVEGFVGAPGLSVAKFLGALEEREVRRLMDRRVLAVLDAVFGGIVGGEPLRRAARTVVDFEVMLGTEEGRRLVLGLLTGEKRKELEDRVGRSAEAAEAGEWTEAEVGTLREFFGLVEEGVGEEVAPSQLVAPRYGLFEHQRSAVARLEPLLAKDERRAVLHLPTGAGKTRTAMHVVAGWLRRHEPSVVVWLASGRELLEQAWIGFKAAWSCLGTRPVQLAGMWGERSVDLERFEDGFLVVGLAKGWSALSRSDRGWAARLAPRVRLVVFDEAQQSVAPTYRRITEELALDFRCAVLGLTATPGRSWADIDRDGELAQYYAGNKVSLDAPGDGPVEYLIEKGFLARPRFRTLLAEPGLDMTREELARISRALDIPEEVVGRLSLSEQYVTAVLGAIEDLVESGHRRVLVFAATVAHAGVVTAVLVARGVRSAVVTGSTPVRVRERAIRAFISDNGEPMVLVNFGVLTTGFDAPKASAAVIARPTKSLVLYSQMVGRAIRGPRAGGTESCEVVTVVDPRLPGFGDIASAFLNWEDVWR